MQESNYHGRANNKRYPIGVRFPVFAYRNLNATMHDVVFSLRSQIRISHPDYDTIASHRVFHHSPTLFLEACEFSVNAYGRRKVRESGRKSVHAGVKGNLLSWDAPIDLAAYGNWRKVSYDPYRDDQFHDEGGLDVASSLYAILTSRFEEGRWRSLILIPPVN